VHADARTCMHVFYARATLYSKRIHKRVHACRACISAPRLL